MSRYELTDKITERERIPEIRRELSLRRPTDELTAGDVLIRRYVVGARLYYVHSDVTRGIFKICAYEKTPKTPLLLVVDMQNDFVDGALPSDEARATIPGIASLIAGWRGVVAFTQDTHGDDYPSTLEGKLLPVPHCVRGTRGWEIVDGLRDYVRGGTILKNTFAADLSGLGFVPSEIHVVGTRTDVCVISNVLGLRRLFPDVRIVVHADLCSGTTPELHESALAVMESCHVDVVR